MARLAYTGTKASAGHPNPTSSGEISGAQTFAAASSDYISVNDATNPTTYTVSAWVKPSSNSTARIIFCQTQNSICTNAESQSLILRNTGVFAAYVWDGAPHSVNGATVAQANTWYYVTATGTSNGNLTLYVNGASEGTPVSVGSIWALGNSRTIGQGDSNFGAYWDGGIDEVRVSTVARTGGWIATEYNNQGTPSTFYSVGAQQSQGGSGGWYSSSWSNRKPITISHTQVSGASNLSNFPVLISVTDANLKTTANGGNVGQANGNDILFTAADGLTKLNHEIETYNGSTGQLVAWVQVPTVSPTTDTSIYVYFGNATAANQQNATAVWDTNYKGVWHLPQASGHYLDSTSNGNSSNSEAVTNRNASGEIGGAAGMTGASDNIALAANTSLNWGASPLTFSAWINISAFTYGSPIITLSDSIGRNPSFSLIDDGTGHYKLLGDYNGSRVVTGATTLAVNTWYYAAMTYDPPSGAMAVYLNGGSDGSASYFANENGGTGTSGYLGGTGAGNSIHGTLDEARVSIGIARSADWIKTEYNNQSSPGTFYTVGGLQSGASPQVTAPSYSPAPGNYTANQSVTITTPTTGATIRYTTDGTVPSQTNGTTYTGPVSIAANETLKAYAYETGYTDSPLTSGGYAVQTGGSYPPFVTSYTYDALNHLIQVSMPRGTTTQTRSFNYNKTVGTTLTVGGDLLSATNPENGTVTYTYDGNHRLATKTDANGTVFTYSYDGFNRLLTISVGGSPLRTYTYDQNTIDSTYSQNVNGRLATITYPVISYDVPTSSRQGTTTFTDMFSYTAYGAVVGKRLRVTKTNPYGTNQTQTAVGDLNMSYAYNAEGKLASVVYPTDAGTNTTPGYNYSFDAMMRPSGMTDQNSASVVSGVVYGAGNEMLQMTYDGGTETRSYNTMFQLTNITFSSGAFNQNLTYNFPAGTNNGKIASQSDAVSGETVSYQYDSLNRLISASAASWSQTYSYDGFGNLTGRVGTGTAQSTTISTPADAATNRLSGYSYDANGNLLSTGNLYDAENRLRQANMPGGTIHYLYDGQNKRIWQGQFTNANDPQMLTIETVAMFGADGKLAGSYTPQANWNNTQNQATITFAASSQRVYFAGKLIKSGGNVIQDRSGSVGKFYPYGEQRDSTGVMFATYTRDGTGLDYADQRYYANTFGRFMTPDPYRASATSPSNPSNPLSWNRYSYVTGDPVNKYDPRGLTECYMEDEDGNEVDCIPKDVAPADRSHASAAQQAKVKGWLIDGKGDLQTFDTSSENCIVDLALIGLSVDAVEKWAQDVQLENANVVNPAVAAAMTRDGADFTPDPNNPQGLLFQPQDFWQKNYRDVLGTLVHEFAHLEHPDKTDADFQASLNIKVDQTDTANISRKIRDDCFKKVPNPE